MAAPSGAAAPGRAAGAGYSVPSAPSGPLVITGSALAAGGSKAWFTDQNGSPRLYVGDECWSIVANGGEWNSGNYQSTYDTFLSQRAAQGYTGVEVSWSSWNGPNTAFAFSTSQDWDGAWPFTSTSDPSSGFNSTFWARRDYFLNSAKNNGITVVMNITTPFYGNSGGTPQRSWTGTQWTAYANGLAARYASQPNLIWIVGDDYFSDGGGPLDQGLATV